METGKPVIHAEVWSERRRNTVILCDRNRIVLHTQTTNDDSKVTCKKCLTLIRKGE
jgi:hypothetical protein